MESNMSENHNDPNVSQLQLQEKASRCRGDNGKYRMVARLELPLVAPSSEDRR